MSDPVRDILEKAIEEKVFPGCVAGIWYKGRDTLFALGHHTYDLLAPAIHVDSIFDVASVTKVIPVSALALKLIDDGVMAQDDLLITYVPEFTGTYREEITIFHLLTHTLSFDFRLSDCKDRPPDQILQLILSATLSAKPGERFFYANATSILLGLAIERCCGVPLEKASQDILFKPLHMEKTFFTPPPSLFEDIVPTEIDPWRGKLIKGEVHDESAWALRPRIVGSAGLFSTASDILKFMAVLLGDGSSGGNHLFSPQTVRLMCSNQLPAGMKLQAGLGWELNQSTFMGKKCSGRCIGKTGFTGCSVVLDFEKRVAIVLLANHVFPQRRNDRVLINRVRSELADIIYESL